MAEKLVTIKTSEKAHKILRILAAKHNVKQYEVMEFALDLLEKNPSFVNWPTR